MHATHITQREDRQNVTVAIETVDDLHVRYEVLSGPAIGRVRTVPVSVIERQIEFGLLRTIEGYVDKVGIEIEKELRPIHSGYRGPAGFIESVMVMVSQSGDPIVFVDTLPRANKVYNRRLASRLDIPGYRVTVNA